MDAHYDHDTSNWVIGGGRPAMPGLVLYFRVDGRFSLWEFDDMRDRLFHFDIDGGPHIDNVPFTKYGDVVGWVTSPIFGLDQARSIEAEEAIDAARRFLRGEEATNREGLRTKDEIDARLHQVLGGTDPFWPRWIVKTVPS